MNIIFDKDERVKTIDLETLRKTVSLAEYTGSLPASKPLEHHQFIDLVQDKLNNANHVFEIDPVYVSKGESKRIMLLDPEKEGRPESYLFERLITRIHLTDNEFVSNGHNTSIAIGYTERGLQVAFGTNVHICSNMSIFGGSYATTYGANKMPFEKMVSLIEKYISDLPVMSERNFALLKGMKDVSIKSEDISEVIGHMHMLAVDNAYLGGKDAPLNIGQVSSFTRGVLDNLPGILRGSQQNMSLYDFYNHGTQILHPERASDVSTIWENTSNWGDFVLEKFNLNLS